MSTTEHNHDPRAEAFLTLADCLREKRTQHPHSITELDTRLYSDPAWFDHEMETIFKDVPLLICPSAMLKSPGEHFTFDFAGKPMLIVRGKDGQLRCFLNACRHRGVRLAEAPEVKRRPTFTCQYHHWTYNLEGQLTNVPLEEGFPNLDKSCRGLKELPLAEAHGFVWVNPNPEGELNIAEFLGDIAVDLDNFGLADNHYFKQTRQVVNANWKLIIEAFQDGYHVTRLHKNTVGGFFLDSVAAQVREKQHIRSIVARKEFEEALELPQEQWDYRRHTSFSHFIWPSTTTVMHPDYTSQLTLYPLAADKTLVMHHCVVEREPQSDKELAHFERGFEIIDEGVFSAEDLHICEQAQIGVNSGANDTFLVGGYESGLRTFHDILKETTGPYRPLRIPTVNE